MRAAALLLATGCAFHPGTLLSSDGDAADASIATGPFSNITLVSLGTSTSDEDDPTLTPDMLEIYFERSGDIYYSIRARVTDPWSLAVKVPNINTTSTETTPEITPDGLELYYSSGQQGGYDVYVSTRANRQALNWSVGTLLPSLSSNYDDYCPTPATGRVMYLTNTQGTIGDQDVLRASRASETTDWNAPQLVPSASTAAMDTEPFVDASETLMYVIADHGTGRDMFVATRASTAEDWGPRMAVDELNTSGLEGDPWLSPDGHTMYFASDRSGTTRIYTATR